MIIEKIKNIKSGKKELRKFGVIVGIAFGLLGTLFWWRGKALYYCFFILSTILILFGLIMPILLKPIQKVWMTFAILMGWLMTRVILIILFYFVLTPIAFIARLFRKDFLNLRFNGNVDSYWIPKRTKKIEKTDYEKQF